MSGRSFRSVFMVASCAGAALSCYLVSLRVASERAAVEDVETQIVLAQRDIRLLQTEIGTRGRLAQLERWNVKVLSLSAPSADQFLGGGFELARLVQPKRKIDIEAPVVLAAAPGDAPRPRVQGAPAADDVPDLSARALMQTVSLRREVPRTGIAQRPQAASKAATPKIEAPVKAAAAPGGAKAATVPESAKSKPAQASAAKPKAASSEKTKTAASDPLAPLKGSAEKPKKKLTAAVTRKEPAKTP